MGLIRTMGKFCHVECDTRNCNKKMEHIDERVLQQLAGLCGWERRRKQWICPECVNKEKSQRRSGRPTKSKKKTVIQL
jgi:hypothetical protein